MRKSKFSEKQIIETLRAKGVNPDTYYKWKCKYSGM